MGKKTSLKDMPSFSQNENKNDSDNWSNNSQILPGPSSLPFIGNLHQIRDPMHIAFNQMSTKYGPIFKIKLGPQVYAIINDDKIVDDLVIRGGAIYFSSSSHYIPKETLPRDSEIAPYGTYWRTMHSLTRRAITRYIVNTHYQNIIHREVRNFMYRLYQTSSGPTDPTDDLKICILNVLATITYGSRSELTAPTFKRFYNSLAESYSMDANSKITGAFPWLSRTPSSVRKHKSRELKARKRLTDTAKELIVDLQQRVTTEKERQHCFAAQILRSIRKNNDRGITVQQLYEEIDHQTFDEYDSLHLIAMFLFGGTGAVTCQQRWIFAQLSYLPKEQYKIQRELYSLIGQGNYPSPKDYARLPYLRAVIRECLRFRPLGYFTVPHAIPVDDVYRGYHIPAKSTMLVNTNPLHFSSALWDRPKRFIPERFLDANGQLKQFKNDWEDPWVWCKGPQGCIGKELAERMLCTIVAYTLTYFTIQREIDPKTGQPFELNMKGEAYGLDLSAPSNFNLKFVPRAGIKFDELLRVDL
ncbi:11229_t:CDS:2 [Ambispora gerdemannii]|uniref:11229_t:CDS:1 n=1 Tax=Ambispora gerdemannii TaxID=144530 RepID=A0A9N9FII2_9GLOM|nr:11229_t:CDS:2 [Ambispora gerdemannii]